jgi:hypothetical protein
MQTFLFSTQILSPIAAYLSLAQKTLGLDNDYQITDLESDPTAYQVNYEVKPVFDYSQLKVSASPSISLQLTNSTTSSFGGSDDHGQLIRLLSIGGDAQTALTNRDMAIAFVAYGIETSELTFPGTINCGDLQLITKTPVTSSNNGLVFLASGVLKLTFRLNY